MTMSAPPPGVGQQSSCRWPDHEGWDVVAEPTHPDSDSLYEAVPPAMDGAVTTTVRWADGVSSKLEAHQTWSLQAGTW